MIKQFKIYNRQHRFAGKFTNKKITQNGVTIVELLVYMALMSIFLLVLLDIFTATINTKLSSESTSALNMDSRYVLSKLTYDINNADSVSTPAYSSTGSTLQLVTAGVTSTYSLSSGNLTKSIGGVVMSLNGLDTSFDSISFKNTGVVSGESVVQVTATLRSKITVNTKTATQTINTTISTR